MTNGNNINNNNNKNNGSNVGVAINNDNMGIIKTTTITNNKLSAKKDCKYIYIHMYIYTTEHI